MKLAIDVCGAIKRYGSFAALQGVDLAIQEGEFFGLLGPNGAGKSTLINMLAGLVRPTAGTLHVLGEDVLKAPMKSKRLLGVVPQELVYDPFFTVRETLFLQAGYFGVKKTASGWIEELMHELGLADKADANLRFLSGGMKRRVLIAQALVHRPPVVILDEPTAGVDVELRQSLWSFIKRLNQQGHTILLTTHYLEEAENLCRRIAMMRSGKIVALDETKNFLQRHAKRRLKIRFISPLPCLSTLPLQEENGMYVMTLSHPEEAVAVLGTLKQAGAIFDEVEIRSPDLEEVFLEIMHQP